MLSFVVKDAAIVPTLLERLRLILFAESLGGVETLITYPWTQTHQALPEELRRHLGVDERLLRLSVGIEDCDDLIADLSTALT
jgi:cystathionine gamma-synthase